MTKDPAFLFYSVDFYEGTRLMLPEERACYIDLMIYQHQNGYIPNDPKRLLLYCSGVAEATLIAVLKAKFKLCEDGWYNSRLSEVINNRRDYSKKQSRSGAIGQFWKKAKSILSKKEYEQLRDVFSETAPDDLLSVINQYDNEDYSDAKAMLIAMLKPRAFGNGIINKDIHKEKGGVGGKEKTSIETFEAFRKKYPGIKRGLATEFKVLKKHKDWESVLHLLLPALEAQMQEHETKISNGEFCPEWPHLQTWLNQRRWETELPEPSTQQESNFIPR